MRAFAIDAFGETGTIRDLPDPQPGENEVLLRVKAAGLNTTDLAIMSGYMKDYVQFTFPVILGIDAAGVVEKVGPGGTRFAEGDEVYGYVDASLFGRRGTLAELIALPVTALQPKPAALSFEQAAVIGHSSLTATAAIAAAVPESGERVVILGATGGVGSYATQFAAKKGAQVIAVTLGDYAEYARSLGAADVIDYTAMDPRSALNERYPEGIDVVIDLVGMPALTEGVASAVQPGGRVVSIVMPPDIDGLAARGVTGALTTRFAAEHEWPMVAAAILDGQTKVPPVRTFAFDQVQSAYDLQASHHVRGKLAVMID